MLTSRNVLNEVVQKLRKYAKEGEKCFTDSVGKDYLAKKSSGQKGRILLLSPTIMCTRWWCSSSHDIMLVRHATHFPNPCTSMNFCELSRRE